VCAYAGYEDLADTVATEVAPIAAILDRSFGPVRLVHGFDGVIDDLPAEVRDRLGVAEVEARSGELHLGYSSHPEAITAARFRLAAHAAGLASDPRFPGESVAGEARGVVVLWLATIGLEPADVARILRPQDPLDAPSSLPGDVWPGRCHDEEATLVWGHLDLQAGLLLARSDVDDTRRVVTEGWDRWLDPATTRDELLAALGLAPLGPVEEVDPTLAERCV
jgi:hypothetical protein